MASDVNGDVNGGVDDGYGAVADAFRRNFAERKELGAALAVVRDGKVVVDLWGGHRDQRRQHPWERDTLVTVWSTTKGMAATAMAGAHSRGRLTDPMAFPERSMTIFSSTAIITSFVAHCTTKR